MFLNCCGMNFDLHLWGYLWEKEFEPHGVERVNDHFHRNNNTKFLISVSAELKKELLTVNGNSCSYGWHAKLQCLIFLQGNDFLYLVLYIFYYFIWSIVDLWYYINFRCTAQWFNIFMDYMPFKVITKNISLHCTIHAWCLFLLHILFCIF